MDNVETVKRGVASKVL